MNKNKKIKFIITGIILIPLIVLVIYFIFKKVTELTPEAVAAYSNGNPAVLAGIIFLIYLIKSVVMFIPMAFIYILAGAVFEPFYAILFNFLGLILNLTVTFFIGKKLGSNIVQKIAIRSKKAAEFMNDSRKSNITLFFVRISSLFPVELVSLVCGSANYKYWGFLFFSLTAMIPGMIPLTLIGQSITNPFSKEFLIPLAFAALVMIASIIIYKVKKPKM